MNAYFIYAEICTLLAVISVHIRIQSMLEAIEVVNQDTWLFL